MAQRGRSARESQAEIEAYRNRLARKRRRVSMPSAHALGWPLLGLVLGVIISIVALPLLPESPKEWIADFQSQVIEIRDSLTGSSESIAGNAPVTTTATDYFQKGNDHTALGDYEKAIEDYTKVIHLDSQFAEALYNRGWIYYEMGKYKLAKEDYDEYIKLDPDDTGAYFNRGIIYISLEQYELATEDFSEVIHLNPRHAAAYYNMAIAYKFLGMPKIAEREFQKAKELGIESP